ncbi:MAG: hypothetical protein C0603_04720 [Denitrovibrio sp.]|nr:MAG: hypothetical protein C0603_04720 [Denitrovibrio sp.]
MKKTLYLLIIAILFTAFNTSYAKTKNILIIETMPVKVITEHTKAITEYFEMLGIKDLNIKVLKAEGSKEKSLNLLNGEIQKAIPDAVITLATLSSMASHKVLMENNIPQIFAVVADPVGAGIISKENAPTGTNVTGRIYSMLRGTKIDMLMRVLQPNKKIKFGVIHSDYPSAVGDLKGLRKSIPANTDIEFISYEIPYINDSKSFYKMFDQVKDGVQALDDKIDYWWFVAGPLAERNEYHQAILKNSNKTIAMAHRPTQVKDGALMSVAPNFEAGGREIAKITLEILNGKDPGSITVTAPENFILSVNISKIIKLGLFLPSDMLKLAGNNVYK